MISGIFIIIFSNVNVFCGPYISCHVLSLFEYNIIVGNILTEKYVVVKWLNHNEMADFPIIIKFFLKKDNIIPIEIPINSNVKIVIFVFIFNIISCCGIKIQVIVGPIIKTINDKIIIGTLHLFDVWFILIGCVLIIILFEIIDIRIEYDAVNPNDKIIINDKIYSILYDDNNFSKIISFEKNPDLNGNPIKAIEVIPKIVDVNVEFMVWFILIIRPSW